MSTAPALDYSASRPSSRYHFLIRRLHSLTGLVFGGYLVVHLLINATLVEGTRHDGAATVFQQQVDKIHSLPFLPAIEWAFIYLPILYHTFYGIWIIATGHPNVERYGYAKNWFYVLQRISAIVLVFFHCVSRICNERCLRQRRRSQAHVRAGRLRHAKHRQPHERGLLGVGGRLSDRHSGVVLSFGQRVLDRRDYLGIDDQCQVAETLGLGLRGNLPFQFRLRDDGASVVSANGLAGDSGGPGECARLIQAEREPRDLKQPQAGV